MKIGPRSKCSDVEFKSGYKKARMLRYEVYPKAKCESRNDLAVVLSVWLPQRFFDRLASHHRAP